MKSFFTRIYREFMKKIKPPIIEPFFIRKDSDHTLRYVDMLEWRIRPLRFDEYSLPIWEILGVSKEEYFRNPSLGCGRLEAIERYG